MWEIHPNYESAPGCLTDAELLSLDLPTFRARLHAATQTLSVALYRAIAQNSSVDDSLIEAVAHLLNLGHTRADLPENDFEAYAQKLIDNAKHINLDGSYDDTLFCTPEFDDTDREVALRVLHERRSVRTFSPRRVPDELIDKVLQAGMNAAQAQNLQSIHYLVVHEEDEPWLFRGADIPPATAHIAVLQDDRYYLSGCETDRINRILDAGAATTNILNAMYANGLDGVWLTYIDAMFEPLRNRFHLPEYIRLVDFIDFGFGTQTPFPPQRPQVDERIVVRI